MNTIKRLCRNLRTAVPTMAISGLQPRARRPLLILAVAALNLPADAQTVDDHGKRLLFDFE
ncbi:MAG: hypothetical protein ACRES3_04850 [Steroidobacteraceae bacterium]